jgi:hypothetical protein
LTRSRFFSRQSRESGKGGHIGPPTTAKNLHTLPTCAGMTELIFA